MNYPVVIEENGLIFLAFKYAFPSAQDKLCDPLANISISYPQAEKTKSKGRGTSQF